MSLLTFFSLTAAVIFAGFAILYLSKLSALRVSSPSSFARAGRYRPMLRLLSEDDFVPVLRNKQLLRRLRAERTAIFRGYLRCLARDYGGLLAGLRMAAVQSSVDRPDLARAILRNRMLFASLLCRLDMMLFLHCAGIRGIDVTGLVETLDALRAQTAIAAATPSALAA
jgi:hypothetical protein